MTPAQVIIIDTRRASTSEFKPVQVNRGNLKDITQNHVVEDEY